MSSAAGRKQEGQTGNRAKSEALRVPSDVFLPFKHPHNSAINWEPHIQMSEPIIKGTESGF